MEIPESILGKILSIFDLGLVLIKTQHSVYCRLQYILYTSINTGTFVHTMHAPNLVMCYHQIDLTQSNHLIFLPS